MEWNRMLFDGIYQFIGENEEKVIETKWDVTDGKCRELWARIKEEHPEATGYKNFCKAYREGFEEFEAYAARDQKRYNSYWN